MTFRRRSVSELATAGLLLAVIGGAACESRQPTSPEVAGFPAAKKGGAGGGGGGGEIIVDSAEPPEGEQGAVGLQIHVFGSGFEKGAKVAFHLPGETDPDAGMTVQSTEFVSSTEVVATTDIAVDAVVSSRDISVSFRGRRGVGTEAFHVKEGPPVLLESIDLHISLADDDGIAGSGDILANDGYENPPGNDPCVGASYCEDVDYVGAHLAGGNPLMFWARQYGTGGQATVRWIRIDADGDAFDFHGFTDDRIYTNHHLPAVRLGDLGQDGNPSSATSRLIVETEIGYILAFGVDCSPDRSVPEADKPATRVTIARTGDVWTITPNGGAYLCRTSGRGKKALTEQAFVTNASFTMTMTKVGTHTNQDPR